MSRPTPRTLRRAAIAGGLLAGLAVPSAAFAADPPSTAVVLSATGNKISTFETLHPTEATAQTAVTGLAAGDDLVGIDFRPQNGALYGLGFNATAGTIRLYSISVRTGFATAVDRTAADAPADAIPVTGTSATTKFGFDFNPKVDRIRVVSDSGLNARLNPNNGRLVDGDPDTAGAQPDGAIKGESTKIDGAAYTNSQQNATFTSLYTLSGADGALFLQKPPNTGTQTGKTPIKVGGQTVPLDAAGGFDITPGINVTADDAPAPTGAIGFIATNSSGKAVLSAVDLGTGNTTPLGLIGDGNTPVGGLAIEQEAIIGGVPSASISGATGATLKLRRFNTADAASTTTAKEVPITGVAATDIPAAIDYRPQTGQLILLTVNPTANTTTLYLVDPQNPLAPTALDATATPLGTSAPFVDAAGTPVPLPSPATTDYDIDFNPTVDRVRVVTNNAGAPGTPGLNFRLNPNNGAGADGNLGGAADSVPGQNTDAPQNGAATDVSGTAYTNAFGQIIPVPPATTAIGNTVQLGISVAKQQLLTQTAPNLGTQGNPKAITVDGKALGFTAVRGFDVPASVKTSATVAPAGSGLAVLSTATAPGGLYAVDLATGAATLKGTLPGSPTSLAIGDGPPPNVARPVTPPATGGGGTTKPPVVIPPLTPATPVKPSTPATPVKAAFGSSTRITLKLRASRVSRKGPAKITYRNTNKFDVKARFSATTPKSGKRKAIRYSTKSFTLKASKSRTLNVKLPSAAQRVLRSKKKLTIKVTLRVTAPNGKSRNVRKTLTVRLKK